MTALTHSPSESVPKALAGSGAPGGHDGQTLPARLAALASRCERLIRLIADNQRHHERRASLTRELIRTRTKQLRAELRFERQLKRNAS